jgi:hypothetical protein
MTETDWLTGTDPLRMLEFLEGRASDRKLRLFCIAAWVGSIRFRSTDPRQQQVRAAACEFADGKVSRDAVLALAGKRLWAVMTEPAWEAAAVWAREVFHSCGLLREIFGNPFQPPRVAPWQTATVMSIAEGIYHEEAFDRLPILGDALEDAGCTHPDVLDHCRQKGDHVKGCWVVDLLVGKS